MQERLIFSGRGLRCGKTRGNAIVIPSIEPHPKFKVGPGPTRNGYGATLVISSEEEIPLKTCLKGGKIEVQTMRGIRKLRVPAGTCPGDRLRVPGAGINEGDHFVLVKVHYPKKNDLKKDWGFLRVDWQKEDEESRKENSGGMDGIYRALSKRY